MSGYQRPQPYNPAPIGPNFGASIADANSLFQLQQLGEQTERANKLRGILGAPGAIDPTTGMPKTDTISKVMSVDPQVGIKLGENSVLTQQRQLQMQSLRSKASTDQAQLLNDTFAPIVLQHEEAIKSGKVSQEQADIDAQKAWTEAREGLLKGGSVPPEMAQNIPAQWNYQDAKRRAMASDVYLTNVKRQDAQRSEERKERHDEQLNERTGSAIGTDADGKAVFAFPNAPPGKRMQYEDGTPVPPEKQGGFHKVGTGAGAAKDADNAAVDTQIAKDHPDWNPEQVKLERMRRVAGATNKNLQDPSKGWVGLTDAAGNDYQHHNGTGENLDMEGKPYVPQGHSTKIAGPRVSSAANQDRDAVTNVVRSDYEKELARSINLSDPNEKAELDRRILRAEDDRAAGRVGAAAGARVAATGGNDRLSQVRIARDKLQQQLERPLTPADDAKVDEMVLATEDARKQAAKTETPAHAAEHDAMAIADKKIADKEAADGRQLDDAEKALLRQEARSDPKVAEAARKKAETFGVPDTPEERESVAAEAATGMPLTQVIPGYGTSAVAARKQARADAIQRIRDETGMSAGEAGVELANRGIEYASGKRSAGQLTTMLGGTRQAVKQLDYNIDKTLEIMKRLPSTDLSPFINAIIRGEEKWTGNPAYSSLYYSMNAVAMESARLLSGGQASIQQLHDGARKEAERWVNNNMTPASFKDIAGTMVEEGHARLVSFDEAIKEGRLGAKPADTATKPGAVMGTGGAWKDHEIPDIAIQRLRADPKIAPGFDEHFQSPGLAAKILGAKPAPAAQQTPAPAKPAAPAEAPRSAAAKAPANPSEMPDGSIVSQGGKRYRKDGVNWVEIK